MCEHNNNHNSPAQAHACWMKEEKLVKVQCKDVAGEAYEEVDQRKYHNMRQFRSIIATNGISAVMLGTAYIVNKEQFMALPNSGQDLMDICYMELAPVTMFDAEHYVTVSELAIKQRNNI